MDQSQSRWYGIHPAEPKDPTRPGKYVNTWPNTAKLNSAFSGITKPSISTSQPPFCQISQDKCDKAAKETKYTISLPDLTDVSQKYKIVCRNILKHCNLNLEKGSHLQKLKLPWINSITLLLSSKMSVLQSESPLTFI